jgi:hypothetical protein
MAQCDSLVLQLVRVDMDGGGIRNLKLDAGCGTGRSIGESRVPKQACAA